MHSGRGRNVFSTGRARLPAALLLMVFFATSARAGEQPIFGPVTYEVKARYGKENRYEETIDTEEGVFLVKLQLGELEFQRPDVLEFSINGEALIRENKYAYRYLACFVRMKKAANFFELMIKDDKPPAFKRPKLPQRNVVLEIMPANIKTPNVAFGAQAWEDVGSYLDALLAIRSPESSGFAFAAADLKNEDEVRAEAMANLGARRDPGARIFALNRFIDVSEAPRVRGEAALALGLLGETEAIPALMRGVIDPDEEVRTGAVRALSLYRLDDTKGLLMRTLAIMDPRMKDGVVRTFDGVGWRPAELFLELAASPDLRVAALGLEMLRGSTDNRVIEALLAYLERPGGRDVGLIIGALGESKDRRAVAPLSRMAGDPARRRGLEAALAEALAELGDPQSAEPIAEMIKRMHPRARDYRKLLAAYKKLTGTDYYPDPPAGRKGP